MLDSKLGLLVVATILAAVAGCSGDEASSDAPSAAAPAASSGDGSPANEATPAAPAPKPGTFTIAIPAEVIVRGGGSTKVDVAVAKGEGFTDDDIMLEVGALPDGVVAKIDGLSITLEASEHSTFGDAPLLVRAIGGGVTVEETRALVVADKAGMLDKTFATSGLAQGIPQTARGLAMDGLGRLYSSGLHAGPPSKAFIVRYDANGTKDETYGDDDGLTILAPAGTVSAGYEVQTLTDGTSFVSLYATDFAVDRACVAKVDPAGHLVKAFGTDGFACTGEAGKTITPSRLLVLADGSMIHGFTWDDHAVIEKITSAGKRDETFGAKGLLQMSIETGKIIGLAVDSKGRLVVGANLTSGSPLGAQIARFSVEGLLDASFNADGTPGYAPAKYGFVDSAMSAMAIGPNDEIHLGGILGNYAAFVTVDGAGKPNAAFNTVGLQNFPLYDQTTVAQISMAPGKLVAVGKSTAGGTVRPYAAGVRADGQLDEAFGEAGKQTYGDLAMQDVTNVVRAHGRMTFVSSKQTSANAQIIRIWE